MITKIDLYHHLKNKYSTNNQTDLFAIADQMVNTKITLEEFIRVTLPKTESAQLKHFFICYSFLFEQANFDDDTNYFKQYIDECMEFFDNLDLISKCRKNILNLIELKISRESHFHQLKKWIDFFIQSSDEKQKKYEISYSLIHVLIARSSVVEVNHLMENSDINYKTLHDKIIKKNAVDEGVELTLDILRMSVLYGKIDILNFLIKEKQWSEKINEEFGPLTHCARDLPMAHFLVEILEFPVNDYSKWLRYTIQRLATFPDHQKGIELITYLLDRNPPLRCGIFGPMLHIAIIQEDLDDQYMLKLVNLLIQYGAEVKEVFRGFTPLVYAAAVNRYELIRRFYELGLSSADCPPNDRYTNSILPVFLKPEKMSFQCLLLVLHLEPAIDPFAIIDIHDNTLLSYLFCRNRDKFPEYAFDVLIDDLKLFMAKELGIHADLDLDLIRELVVHSQQLKICDADKNFATIRLIDFCLKSIFLLAMNNNNHSICRAMASYVREHNNLGEIIGGNEDLSTLVNKTSEFPLSNFVSLAIREVSAAPELYARFFQPAVPKKIWQENLMDRVFAPSI